MNDHLALTEIMMTVPSELAIHDEAVSESLPCVVRYLVDHLGDRLTAVMAGVGGARVVRAWMADDRCPEAEGERRLRAAFEVTRLLMQMESPDTIRLWFTGMNPVLDDRSPALTIADDPARVLLAARTFLAHG